MTNEPATDGNAESEKAAAPQKTAIGMSMGMCFGVAFGAAFGDVSMGLIWGMIIGMIGGSVLDARARSQA